MGAYYLCAFTYYYIRIRDTGAEFIWRFWIRKIDPKRSDLLCDVVDDSGQKPRIGTRCVRRNSGRFGLNHFLLGSCLHHNSLVLLES